MKISIDFESRSVCDLKKKGAWNYSRHPSTEIICCSIGIQDNSKPVYLWINYSFLPIYYEALEIGFKPLRIVSRETFQDAIEKAEQVSAFNVQFESSLWTNIMVEKLGFPEISVKKWSCSQAISYYHAMPGSLEEVCEALDLEDKKDPRGKYLINKLCKPRRPTKKDPRIFIDDVDLYYEFFEYCIKDTKTERRLIC